MTLQAINSAVMLLRSRTAETSSPSQEDTHPIMRARTVIPISYATLDGGLFVGYYLNIHG